MNEAQHRAASQTRDNVHISVLKVQKEGIQGEKLEIGNRELE